MYNSSSQKSSQAPGVTENGTLPPSSSGYTEAYLTALWTFKPSGIERVLSGLKDLNVDLALYSFEHGFFKVRCKMDDILFVYRNFRKIQEEIEAELHAAGRVNVPDGLLAQEAQHPDVELRGITEKPLLPGFGSEGPTDDQNDRPTPVILSVPDELSDYPTVVAWQQLQNSQVFGTAFIPLQAKDKIEQAYGVKLVADHGQKVIFIGAAAGRGETAEKVKHNIDILLRDFMVQQNSPPKMARHAFLVESTTKWAIDLREMTQVNPDLGRSTVFPQLETYSIFQQQPVYVLRACLEVPLRNGLRNTLWSLFGPRPQTGPQPRLVPLFLKGLQPPSPRVAPPAASQGEVTKWLEGVAMPIMTKNPVDTVEKIPVVQQLPLNNHFEAAAAPTTTLVDVDEDAPIQIESDPNHRRATAADGPSATASDVGMRQSASGAVADDAPIALGFDPSRRRSNLLASQRPDGPGAGLMATSRALQGVMKASLLDAADPVLQDPTSNLQRPLAPVRRTINGQDLDSLPEILPTPTLEDLQGSLKGKTELERLVATLGVMLDPMRSKGGFVQLCAELGRYYAYDLPPSACAYNSSNEPSRGWEADDIRVRLESSPIPGHVSQKHLFTEALSSWGSDADYLAGVKLTGGQKLWQETSKNTYFDVYCQVQTRGQTVMVVVEINSEDWSWSIRAQDAESELVFVHCLVQHWDFQMRLSHVPVQERELEECVQLLVDTFEVFPDSKSEFCLGYRRSVKDIMIVDKVRVRQVARFQHHTQQRIFMAITRVLVAMPTSRNGESIRVSTVPEGFKMSRGTFSQWIEASLSSTFLEEAFKQNKQLVPGEESEWTVDQLKEDVQVLCETTFDLVKRINSLGVMCDNGVLKSGVKTGSTKPKTEFKW